MFMIVRAFQQSLSNVHQPLTSILHFHMPNNIKYYDLRRRLSFLDNIKYILYYNIIRHRFLHTKT